MPADKTPGQVAYEAHAYALVKETGIGTNTWWSSLPEHEVKVWEAVGLAVREQTLDEIQAKLIAEERYYSKHHAGWVNDYEILTDVKRIAAAPIQVP